MTTALMTHPTADRESPPAAANDPDGTLRTLSFAVVSPTDHKPVFTRLERTVIGIGRRDPLSLIAPGSRLARLRRLLFGIEVPLPFADRRLEALRRLTLALRRPSRRPDAEIVAALQAGVTQRQVEHLRLITLQP